MRKAIILLLLQGNLIFPARKSKLRPNPATARVDHIAQCNEGSTKKDEDAGLEGGAIRIRFAHCSKSMHWPRLACPNAFFLMTPIHNSKHQSCAVHLLQNVMLIGWGAQGFIIAAQKRVI